MSNTAEKLAERGTLPALAPGETATFSPGLIAAADAEYLPIHFAASIEGIEATWDNTPNALTPSQSSTVTFRNVSNQAIAAGAPYLVQHDHTLQLAPDTIVSRAAVVPVASTANTAYGTFEAFSNDAQAIAVGAPATLVALVQSNEFGGLGGQIVRNGTNNGIVLPAATIQRSYRVQARLQIESDAIEPALTVDLVTDATGAPAVVQRSVITLNPAGATQVIIDTIITIAASATAAARTIGLLVDTPAGNLTVGLANQRGVEMIVSTL